LLTDEQLTLYSLPVPSPDILQGKPCSFFNVERNQTG